MSFIFYQPNKKRENYTNAFLIYRALTWMIYKDDFPIIKQQNYSVATGKKWKLLPDGIKNIYTQLSITLSEEGITGGYLIYRVMVWECKKEFLSDEVASNNWKMLGEEGQSTYVNIYINLLTRLSEEKKRKKNKPKRNIGKEQKTEAGINEINSSADSIHYPNDDDFNMLFIYYCYYCYYFYYYYNNISFF
jgi:hypothetical protein